MPATQKKLTSFPVAREPLKAHRPFGGQRTLDDLKKVVLIKGGAHNFDISELEQAKAIIESRATSLDDVLNSLRRLSCLQITRKMLLDVPIGVAVRSLKNHSNPEVARIATALVDKWKRLVLSE